MQKAGFLMTRLICLQTEKTHMRELAQGIREKLHVLLKQEPDKKILKLNTGKISGNLYD